jgi:hypothetical protein
MKAGGRNLFAAAVAASALGLAVAGPADASRARCLDNAPPSSGVVTEDGKAMVLVTTGHTYYRCRFSKGRVRKLPGQGRGHAITRGTFEVADHHVGYASERFGGDEAVFVRSINYDTGHGHKSREDDGVTVHNVILKDNGSIAWSFSWDRNGDHWSRIWKMDKITGYGTFEVANDERGGEPRDLIDPFSLELAAGGTRIGWSSSVSGGHTWPLE